MIHKLMVSSCEMISSDFLIQEQNMSARLRMTPASNLQPLDSYDQEEKKHCLFEKRKIFSQSKLTVSTAKIDPPISSIDAITIAPCNFSETRCVWHRSKVPSFWFNIRRRRTGSRIMHVGIHVGLSLGFPYTANARTKRLRD